MVLQSLAPIYILFCEYEVFKDWENSKVNIKLLDRKGFFRYESPHWGRQEERWITQRLLACTLENGLAIRNIWNILKIQVMLFSDTLLCYLKTFHLVLSSLMPVVRVFNRGCLTKGPPNPNYLPPISFIMFLFVQRQDNYRARSTDYINKITGSTHSIGNSL